MLYITKLLAQWGICVPPDTDYAEYLRDHLPRQFRYIDQCPFSVGEKHSQVELLYQEVMTGHLRKNEFLEMERKYRNVLTKLWLYNDLYVESDIHTVRIKRKFKAIDRQYRKEFSALKKKFKQNTTVRIECKSELELLVQICVRSLAYAAFHFAGYELVIVPSWSCFMAFFHDETKLTPVEKIVTTEGLYLRNV